MTSCALDMFASGWKLEKGDLVWLQFTINLWKGAENSSPFLISGAFLIHSIAVLLFCSSFFFFPSVSVLVNERPGHELMVEINNLNPVVHYRDFNGKRGIDVSLFKEVCYLNSI